MCNILNYYENLYINNKNINIRFYIILNDNNNEIYINNIHYYLNNDKIEDIKEKIYHIKLKISLDDLYIFIKMHYNIYKYYDKSIFELVYFNNNAINYCLDLILIHNILDNQQYKLYKYYLNLLNKLLIYYIYKGINKLKIDKITLNKKYEQIINKLKKNK